MAHPVARLVALAAAACFLTVPARAALVTDVADAAEENDPLDVNLDFGWRLQHRTAKIVRENVGVTTDRLPLSELVTSRTTQVFEAGLAIGLFHDLELHFRLPIALQDHQRWDYARANGQSLEDRSVIRNNREDADGRPLATPQPLFPVPGDVFRGGLMDPSVGVAWGIFNDQRDRTVPAEMFPHKPRVATWVIGFDYTAPLAKPANPMQALSSTAANALSLGGGAHRLTWWTAMSKRLGIVDPFLKLHYTYSIPNEVPGESGAWDNCKAKANGGDPDNLRMSGYATDKCAKVLDRRNNPNYFWNGKTGLIPPHVGGLLVGTEIIPVEESDGLRLSIGVQLAADFVSKGRTFSAVSDQLRKLTYTDQFFRLDGRLALDLRVNQWVHFVTTASIGTETPHFLTSETVGRDRYGETPDDAADGRVSLGTSEVNPNYDFRLDQPGRRLRLTEVSVFGLSAMVAVNF